MSNTEQRRRLLLVGPSARVENAASRLRGGDSEVLPATSVAEAGDRLWTADVDRVVCTEPEQAQALDHETEAPVVLLGADEATAPEGVAAAGTGIDAPADELFDAVETAVERQRLGGGQPVERVDPIEPEYATLVEEAGSGMFLLEEGRIHWVNDRLADLLWYDADELVGVKLVALVAEGDRAAAEAAADPGAERQVAVAGRRKDGSTVPLFVRTSPVEHDGDLVVAGTVLPREEGRVDDIVDGGVPTAGRQ
jgi:PAS domain S-box-containing protein